MADTIYVKAHPKIGDKVGLWDADPRHPANPAGEHEIFVAGQDQEPVECFRTTRVLDALRAERIIEVTAKGGKAKQSDTTGAGGGNTVNPLAPPTPENPETTPANGQG